MLWLNERGRIVRDPTAARLEGQSRTRTGRRWRLTPSATAARGLARRSFRRAALPAGVFRAALHRALPAALRRAALFRSATGGRGGFAAGRFFCRTASFTAKEPRLLRCAHGRAGGLGRCLGTA